jgi:hypothetical protein
MASPLRFDISMRRLFVTQHAAYIRGPSERTTEEGEEGRLQGAIFGSVRNQMDTKSALIFSNLRSQK